MMWSSATGRPRLLDTFVMPFEVLMNTYNDVILFLNSIYFPNHRILDFIREDLLNHFIGIKKEGLSRLTFLSEGELTSIASKLPKFNLDSYIHQLDKHSIKYLTILQEGYPDILRQIPNPPAIIFYKGNIDKLHKGLAVVGARKASDYGIWATKSIISQLRGKDLAIISGMARGIDRQAHLAALDSGLSTIGVLASSLDIQYPASNRDLYRLMDDELLISEYGLKTSPLKYNFVSRNRIIAGLAFATLVVEAEEKSGSIITANYALEQGRDVFAIPGRINDIKSCGCNKLISKGARLVTSASDIVEEYPYLKEVTNLQTSLDKKGFSDLQLRIIARLDQGLVSFDSLLGDLDIDLTSLYKALIKLEMEGVIIRVNKNYFSLRT